jgi:hypothetical protein
VLFYRSRSALHDPQEFDLFPHIVALIGKFPYQNMRQTPKFLDELLSPDNGAISKIEAIFRLTIPCLPLHRWVQRSIILSTTTQAHVFKINGSYRHLIDSFLLLWRFAKIHIAIH